MFGMAGSRAIDTTAIEAAYGLLLREATAGDFVEPGDGEWGVDQVLAHLVIDSRMLCAACADLLDGRIPVVDNRPTQSPRYLEAIIKACGDRQALVAELERVGRELIALVAEISNDQANAQAPTIIMDGGVIRVERPVPISDLLGSNHLDLHTSQLLALRR
jgi:hypothetical protein